MASPTQFYIPDLPAVCPLVEGSSTNPHYEKAGVESSRWVSNYKIFTNRKRLFFVLGSNELLVSHTYPYAGYEEFRTVCDLVNLLFVIDEISDEQAGDEALKTGLSVVNVFKDPKWTDGSVLAQMAREFRERLNQRAGPDCLRRWIKTFDNYIQAVAHEAELRARNEVLGLEAYIPLRRENSAIRVCFGVIEYVLGIDLPDEVFDDPVFMEMYLAAVDTVFWSNDLYSYNMEQSKGLTGNNVMTVLMNEKNMTLQEASDYIGVHFKTLVDTFMGNKQKLRSWGAAVDRDVAEYIKGMEKWIVGNVEWSLVTQRYFGAEVAEVKRTRLVKLRPREEEDDGPKIY
ncbi:terpenoid synthase [Neolentinus lepideus HHB14362 ss-1]|uniref:Terpene synthase n=1 Tax=Neolentinus lepideus HHB14362 ss-1 TaxID=1314782 RepID=A0A165VIA1_9AGAM|nr:terpenoid synthase [Neolentinus lepideus HHB14362 ss-1]